MAVAQVIGELWEGSTPKNLTGEMTYRIRKNENSMQAVNRPTSTSNRRSFLPASQTLLIPFCQNLLG
jgi:hypothetical protein